MPVIQLVGVPNCPLCERAKSILRHKGIEFIYVNARENQEVFEKLTSIGHRAMPAFFLMGEGEPVFMGGYPELTDYIKQSGGVQC